MKQLSKRVRKLSRRSTMLLGIVTMAMGLFVCPILTGIAFMSGWKILAWLCVLWDLGEFITMCVVMYNDMVENEEKTKDD